MGSVDSICRRNKISEDNKHARRDWTNRTGTKTIINTDGRAGEGTSRKRKSGGGCK